jgi:hypothetical protein
MELKNFYSYMTFIYEVMENSDEPKKEYISTDNINGYGQI